MTHAFDTLLLKDAEAIERKMPPFHLARLQHYYATCRALGLSDDEIREMMALTPRQMQQVKK